jgi:hypothetical protein
LNQRTKYHGLSLRPRLNKDIVEGRFDISEIIRIERKNDEHTISDKTFDFSSGTIRHLLNDGYKDIPWITSKQVRIEYALINYYYYYIKLQYYLVVPPNKVF